MSTEKKSEKQKTCVEKKEKCAKFFTSRSLHFVAPAPRRRILAGVGNTKNRRGDAGATKPGLLCEN
jgi:hypothetical protein